MSDILFQANARNPDHRRDKVCKAIEAEEATTRSKRESSMRTIGEVAKKVIVKLEVSRNLIVRSKPNPRIRMKV